MDVSMNWAEVGGQAHFHKIRWIINVIWIYKSTMIRNYNKLISISITIIVKTPTQPNLT